MEEIKVGEYVRTNQGYIVTTDENFIDVLINGKSVFGKAIKHSFNLIDLIEVGDYVNGIPVVKIDRNVVPNVIIFGGDYKWITYREIKSIVTHEQFESVECRVGEE